MATQSVRLLYCYLREKWTTLEILERDATDFPVRTYQCLGADAECVKRRCRLSGDDCRQAEDAQEPWFDE
ncbi:MAG: hypothetical protein HY710_07180 [Candidatus Latescibacteria bacterium]|nr:hypothetical protein [Candidatus Latescibacterota bacterium]